MKELPKENSRDGKMIPKTEKLKKRNLVCAINKISKIMMVYHFTILKITCKSYVALEVKTI